MANGRRDSLSAAEARRLALAAQGFGDRRDGDGAAGWALRRVMRHVGLLQLDSVNVVVRAHYLPPFSRIGPYDRGALDRASHRAPRRLFEYIGHEASLLPVALQPLLRWRMDRAADEAWGSVRRIRREHPDLVHWVLEQVATRGPIPASAIVDDHAAATGTKRQPGPWWDWSEVKWALAWLFWSGQITAARRRNFERLYDLPDRVIPRDVLATPTPTVADAQRALLRIASRALGVATERDLRDYFRLPTAEAKARIADLVEAGEVVPVAVEGWGRAQAYLAAGARIPREVCARALIGPFDSLIWERARVRRVFGFQFRIEIYVPAAKRVHGYYVLPFLLGDRLVARVDLKADRARGTLLVRAVHLEPEAPPETTAELREEIETLANWLELDSVALPWARRG